MKIIYRYLDIQAVVDFALKTLRERSPVGSGNDKHPGLYRDSHLVFLNGHVVKNVSGWKPGDQINISNPVPYSRKLEGGPGKSPLALPGHVYESSAQLVAARYGNQVAVKFVFMPVRFGDVGAYAAFSRRIRPGRKLSDKARKDWLVRQPAIEIRSR